MKRAAADWWDAYGINRTMQELKYAKTKEKMIQELGINRTMQELKSAWSAIEFTPRTQY